MANLMQRSLPLASIRSPVLQFLRFRGKINIQRPKEPHYERARVIAVTQPKYPELPKARSCFKTRAERTQEQLVNPYNEIIAREVRNWLNHSQLVAIFHMNSISSEEVFRVRVQLHKQNLHLKSYGRKIINQAVTGTQYEAIMPLFHSNHCIVFSPNQQQIGQLLKITRRVPQMVLLGGIVEQTLLSRNELVAYAQMPGLQGAQAQLVQTLNMAAGQLVQHLQAHQGNLVQVLDVHVKGTSNGNSTETTDES
ncbi:39S ribosomal protein L10, mitochondrial [Drosophila guanche]|uniref:Large ribosomal subunit protein uL10m n=1 Tax=Drosophila guanche TaxID=7266 RepID=A0A3B0K8L0_DROGU|nr:39S ribosomal protein L10, mitochondrial [Drosophila guanche]XP_034129245.1 39S ribosomal protein L10, mitochondrial [Drosophila guanche]SPP81966.1 blast:39S ribosomal protein L10%2C mitochondrial [Drosophila guanche]